MLEPRTCILADNVHWTKKNRERTCASVEFLNSAHMIIFVHISFQDHICQPVLNPHLFLEP